MCRYLLSELSTEGSGESGQREEGSSERYRLVLLLIFFLSVGYRKSNGITLIVVLDLLLGLGVSHSKRH